MLDDAAIRTIFSRFAETTPHPVTELEAPNDFCLLISIVLSAQSTDVAVNKATKPLYAMASTPEALLALGEDGLKEYIKTIGLYHSKARNIMALCTRLLDHYAGIIPRDRDELQTLAGVGRKTANVWLNCVYGEPWIAVDTHVFRVSNRLGLCNSSTVDRCEKALMERIPLDYRTFAHHWLILHGRYVCKARTPLCSECCVRDVCCYRA
ncbi:MAG: endonuclease III [Alphaproteobacteria bacterium]|nr:MAG: endonuclease III [Alphaproteobacteria bacterium]